MSRMNGKKKNSMSTDEFEMLNKSGQLVNYLNGEFELFERALEDDRRFCEKEIDSTRAHLKKLEEKLIQKINEMRSDLDKLQRKNEEVYQGNKLVYDERVKTIDELSDSGRQRDAWCQYQQYKEMFDKREKVIEQIPTVPIAESLIDDLFSMETTGKKSLIVSQQPTTPTSEKINETTNIFASDDDGDESKLTEKEQSRRKKKVEKTDITKDTDQDRTSEHEDDVTTTQTFASRSIHCPGLTDNSSSIMTKPLQPGFSFSNRLKQSARNSSVTTTASPPTLSVFRQSVNSNVNSDILRQLTIDPIFEYAHDKNTLLLMAATARHITMFKSQHGRVDRWQFGLINRSTQQTQMLTWNDGLITSMGYIDNSRLFIFTERDFTQFDTEANRKIHSRMLPRGNDDVDYDTGDNPYENLQRGIGTVFDGFYYHLFSNRKSNWVLSKSVLRTMLHVTDYPVSQQIGDVHQWIHFNINYHSLNFLVQLDDDTFAVLFCSFKDDIRERKRVVLLEAEHPLSIRSVFISQQNNYIYFVNERSKRIIHILNQDSYLDSYPTIAHAIDYVEEKNQLIIVGDKMISSMNLNSLFSS